MKDLNVIDEVAHAGDWVVRNQALLLQYVVNIVFALVMVVVGLFVARIISRIIVRLMSLRSIDNTVTQFLAAIIRYIIIAIAVIAALGSIGVQTTSIIAVIGAAGLAVGLALQGSLANFAAGVLLVMFHPFRSGETVDLGGVVGTVHEVLIFSTSLRMADNKLVIIPNGKIISGNIINYSRPPERRIELIISVAYGADIDLVKKTFSDLVISDKRIDYAKGITVRLNEITPIAQNFIVNVWTSSENYQEVYFDLLENIKRAVDSHKIGANIQ